MRIESDPFTRGVIARNVAPVRAEPDTDSQQLTQALIGENVTLGERFGDWAMTTIRDGVMGWVREDAWVQWAKPARDYGSARAVIVRDLIVDARVEPFANAPILTKLTYGAVLASRGEAGGWAGLKLPDGTVCFVPGGWTAQPEDDSTLRYDARRIVSDALRFVGTPYLWGGKSPFGLDCSGLIQLLHQSYGVHLPRNSRQQSESDLLEDAPLEEIRAGDLLFFASGGEVVNHVGMAVGSGKFIHASGARGVNVMDIAEPRYADILVRARRVTAVSV